MGYVFVVLLAAIAAVLFIAGLWVGGVIAAVAGLGILLYAVANSSHR